MKNPTGWVDPLGLMQCEVECPGVGAVSEPNVVSGLGKTVKMDGHKIYDSNFPALSTNPNALYRFSDPMYRQTGNDIYFGENSATSYFEVRKDIKDKSLFVGEVEIDNMLDLTDPDIIKEMNIDPAKLAGKVDNEIERMNIYEYTNKIANQAHDEGYNGLIYSSKYLSIKLPLIRTLFKH